MYLKADTQTDMILYVTVKEITLDQLPKARRRRLSPIKKTRDWKDVVDRIVSGDFEALKVEFSPETLKLGKSAPDRFKRMLAEEIRTLKPGAGIRLTFRGRSANGAPVLYVLRLLSTNPRIRN
jgi:hypothetical protein